LGNFFEYEKNVLISNYARYICYYYTNKNNNKKRLDVSSRIERLVSEKLNKSYSLTFLRYDFNSNLFELDIEGEKLVFGLKGLKRFLRKIGVNENEIKEIIEKVKEEIKRENEKRRTEQNKNKKLFDYDYDYYYYFR
jgi:transcriptional regulator NrdR family protein